MSTYIVLYFTIPILLAAIGLEMANNPPTKVEIKWFYRLAFIILSLALTAVNVVLTRRDAEEKKTIRAEAARAQLQTEEQLKDVKAQLSDAIHLSDAILSAVRTSTKPQPLKIRALELAKDLYELADKHVCLRSGDPSPEQEEQFAACNRAVQPEYLSFYDSRVREITAQLKAQGVPSSELADKIGYYEYNNFVIRFIASQLVRSAKSL